MPRLFEYSARDGNLAAKLDAAAAATAAAAKEDAAEGEAVLQSGAAGCLDGGLPLCFVGASLEEAFFLGNSPLTLSWKGDPWTGVSTQLPSGLAPAL